MGASNQVTVTLEMLGVGAEDTAEGRITFSDFQGAAGLFHRDGQAVTSFTSREVADGRIAYHALQDGLTTLSFTASYSKQGGAHISEARYDLVIRDLDDFSDFYRLVTRPLSGGGQSTAWQKEVWNPNTQQHDIFYDINFDGPTVILLDHNAAKALTPFLLNQALIGGDDIYHIRQTQIGGTFQERVGDNQVPFLKMGIGGASLRLKPHMLTLRGRMLFSFSAVLFKIKMTHRYLSPSAFQAMGRR